VARRAEAIGRAVDELKESSAAGSPAEVAETLRRYAEAGATRSYLQIMDLDDLDHLELIASEVRPLLS
jgi:alkanesulfonate monooxygenase SsuD/methylene tetrahydromethanopterin reductase-like flavin-dependent oxidoreductase (luciferase family)